MRDVGIQLNALCGSQSLRFNAFALKFNAETLV